MTSDHIRPRALAWGGETQREILLAIADDIRSRSGFGVCAIEVARADGMLEFVAIAGNEEGEQQLLGQASPIAAMFPALDLGADYGAFTFVAGEWLTAEAEDFLGEYGFIPDLPEPATEDAWRAEDMLAARIIDDHGRLRGILYLDEPTSGVRPTPEEFLALSDRLSLQLRAVLTAVEREELSNQARVSAAASDALRGLSSRTSVAGFLEEARPHVVEGLRAEQVEIRLFQGGPEQPMTLAPGFRTDLDTVARRAWERRTVVIFEHQAVWGDPELSVEVRHQLSDYVDRVGALALVCVPLGTADEPVGYLLVLRTRTRWTEVESIAAHRLGEDLGRAVTLARAFEREQHLTAELQRVDSRRTEFARTVSHELKNPLTVVVAHLELLEDSDLTERQQAWVQAASRATGRLEGLLRDLAQVSRDSVHTRAHREVDLRSLVREAAVRHQVVAARRGVSVATDVPATGVSVLGDAAGLTSVVDNLLNNAVKYSDPGAAVTVRLQLDGPDVVFTCADEGIGISREDQRRLFTDFFRSTNEAALTRPGTGLGLSIVRNIVDQHGGHVEVESTLGVGTTFTVRIPIASD